MQKDYAEILFQSIDEILTKRLEGISYDITDIVTIVDNSEAEKGKYKVSDLSATYYAYSSDTSYKLDDAVYVTIPNGDYTQQKIIIGKYIAKNATPFVFQSPFETIVDTSGNLIADSVDSTGLIANYPDAETILLWSQDFTGEKYQLKGYTRLGLQGQFRSWLESFDCKTGNYGYILKVYSDKEITTSTQLAYQKAIESAREGLIKENDPYITNTLKLTFPAEFYALETIVAQIAWLDNKLASLSGSCVSLLLESNDMYGNPFDFESFYQQEKVFDISSLDTITRMELYFFQEVGTFIDNKNVPIPYQDEFDMLLSPNLFTKDPYICLGYDISEFADDQATIYTINGTTYSSSHSDEENKKNLLLRWVHDRAVIQQKDYEALNAEIRWYRYALGSPSADEYSGVYWKRVESAVSTISSTSGMEFQFSFIPDVSKSEEMIKAIILYDDKVIVSNILTFSNEKEVVNDATKDFLAGLNIWCADGTYGNYYIYAPGNKILEQFRTTEAHRLKAIFSAEDSLLERNNNASYLTEAESITWTFSTKNTMIRANNIDYLTKIDDVTTVAPSNFSSYSIDVDSGYWTYITSDGTVIYDPNEETISITRTGDPQNGYTIDADQLYFISETYAQSAQNNVIQCKIVKDGVEYYTSKRLFFGQAGTTGTDATLRIYFDPANKHAVYTGEDSMRVRAVLFDSQNREVNLNDETDFSARLKWEWYSISSSGSIKIEPVDGTNSTTEDYNLWIINKDDIETDNEQIGKYYQSTVRDEVIVSSSNFSLNDFMILKVTLKDWGDYDLVTCRPVPVAASSFQYNDGTWVPRFVDCAEEVIYGTAGYPDYYKEDWALHYAEDKDANGSMDMPNSDTCYWEIWLPFEDDGYAGAFSDNILSPMPFYVEGAEPYGAQYTCNGQIIWSQPIFVLQNNYPSSTLNKWDGKTLTIDYDNGRILATAIAAGSKNKSNEFSGVMMGDWSDSATSESKDITKTTGLYGFHEGAMSFAFREDGSAFIGKSGKGRLLFDGDNSTIQSESYSAGYDGMIIDFDDGFIKMFNGSKGKIEIDSGASVYPLVVGDKFSVQWDGTVNATDGVFSGTVYATDGSFSGNIEAKTGTIGGFSINDHALFTPIITDVTKAEAIELYSSAADIYLGKTKHGSSYSGFRLGNSLLFDGSAGSGNGRLFISANIYKFINDEQVITSLSDAKSNAAFLIGVNTVNSVNRLQIGSAMSGRAGYDGISMYGNGGGIYLVPSGSSITEGTVKVSSSEIKFGFGSSKNVSSTGTSGSSFYFSESSFVVTGIDAANQKGIYARFA